ncbi:hypothetical protein NADFUDRAFT_82311, partial [Nadsonia fulvescens var. elongata DSM 6958]
MSAPKPGISPTPSAGVNLAKQYEDDKSRIIKSCFSKPDKSGVIPENYITHVRIIEDSHYPSSRPPPNSASASEKHRTLIISYLKTGPVRVHKARQNADGSFQIGKTWNLIDLTRVENDLSPGFNGFKMHFSKIYYWQTNTPIEKEAFLKSLINAYRKYTRGKLPELVGLDPNFGMSMNASRSQKPPPNANVQSAVAAAPTAALAPASVPPIKANGEQGMKGPLVYPDGSKTTTSSAPATAHLRRKSTSEFLHKPVTAAGAVVSSMSNMMPHHSKPKEKSSRPPSPGRMKSLINTAMHSPSQNITPPTTPTVNQISSSSPSINGSSSPGKQKRTLRNSPSISSLSSRLSQSSLSSKLTRSATSIFPSKKAAKAPKPLILDEKSIIQPPFFSGDSNNSPGVSPTSSHVSSLTNFRDLSTPIRGSVPLSIAAINKRTESLDVFDGSSDLTGSIPHSTPTIPPANTAAAAPEYIEAPQVSLNDGSNSSPSMAAAFKATFDNMEISKENVVTVAGFTSMVSSEPSQNTIPLQIAKNAPASMATAFDTSIPKSTSVSEPFTLLVNGPDSEPSQREEYPQNYEDDTPTNNQVIGIIDEDTSSKAKRKSVISDISVFTNRKSFQEQHNLANDTEISTTPYMYNYGNNEADFDSDVTDEEFMRDRRLADERFDTDNEETDDAVEEEKYEKVNENYFPADFQAGNEGQIIESVNLQGNTLPSLSRQSQIDIKLPEKNENYIINDNGNNSAVCATNSEADALALEGFLTELDWNGRDDSEKLGKKMDAQLAEIESTVISNIIGVDSRLDSIEGGLDKAIKECEMLDMVFSIFSAKLGAFSKDISHIESQGEGLQVKAVNQKHLYDSLSNIIRKANTSTTDYSILLTADLNDIMGVQTMEQTLTEIYGIIKDFQRPSYDDGNVYIGEMKIMRDRDHGYEQILSSFVVKFTRNLTDKLEKAVYSAESQAITKKNSKHPSIEPLEKFLDPLFVYSSVLLFLQDIDSYSYQSLLKSYESIVSNYFNRAFAAFFSNWLKLATMDDPRGKQFWFSHKENSQSVPTSSISSISAASATPVKSMKRSHTLARLKSAATGDFKETRSVPLPQLSQNSPSNTIPLLKKKEIFMRRFFVPILTTIRETLAIQNEILIQFFHLSSFAQRDFNTYVNNNVPLANRKFHDLATTTREADADRLNSTELFNVMKNIFPKLDKAPDFFHELLLYNPIECPSLLILIEKLLSETCHTNQEFLNNIYIKIHARIRGLWSKFIEDQIRSINQTLISSKKRRYILNFIRVFPDFCEKIESQLTHDTINPSTTYKLQSREGGQSTRELVDESYEKISKAIFYNLRRIAKDTTANSTVGVNKDSESTDYEDKTVLNHHILMVENMNYWTENLGDMDNEILSNILTLSRVTYGSHLGKYVNIVIHRPLGRLMDFIEAIDVLLLKDPKVNLV